MGQNYYIVQNNIEFLFLCTVVICSENLEKLYILMVPISRVQNFLEVKYEFCNFSCDLYVHWNFNLLTLTFLVGLSHNNFLLLIFQVIHTWQLKGQYLCYGDSTHLMSRLRWEVTIWLELFITDIHKLRQNYLSVSDINPSVVKLVLNHIQVFTHSQDITALSACNYAFTLRVAQLNYRYGSVWYQEDVIRLGLCCNYDIRDSRSFYEICLVGGQETPPREHILRSFRLMPAR